MNNVNNLLFTKSYKLIWNQLFERPVQ